LFHPAIDLEAAMIRPVQLSDADAIAGIYDHYILNTVISFEEVLVSPLDMKQRIEETRAAGLPWLVAEREGEVVGYAYASKWKGRCAYRYSVETTVYLEQSVTQRGIGSQLYMMLLAQLRALNYHAAIGGIALPNEASVKLHEKLGFQKVAHFKEVGFKLDRWLDVGYWELIL
jgi:L-amino acid N-acyltransferase YncA